MRIDMGTKSTSWQMVDSVVDGVISKTDIFEDDYTPSKNNVIVSSDIIQKDRKDYDYNKSQRGYAESSLVSQQQEDVHITNGPSILTHTNGADTSEEIKDSHGTFPSKNQELHTRHIDTLKVNNESRGESEVKALTTTAPVAFSATLAPPTNFSQKFQDATIGGTNVASDCAITEIHDKLEPLSSQPAISPPKTSAAHNFMSNNQNSIRHSIHKLDNENGNQENECENTSHLPLTRDPTTASTPEAAKEQPSPSVTQLPAPFLSPRDLRYVRRSSLKSGKKKDPQQPSDSTQGLLSMNLELTFGKENRGNSTMDNVDANCDSAKVAEKSEVPSSRISKIAPTVSSQIIKNDDDINGNNEKRETVNSETAAITSKARRRRRRTMVTANSLPNTPTTTKKRRKTSATVDSLQNIEKCNADDANIENVMDNDNESNYSSKEHKNNKKPMSSTGISTGSPAMPVAGKYKSSHSSEPSPKGFLSPRDLRYLKRSKSIEKDLLPSHTAKELFKTDLQPSISKKEGNMTVHKDKQQEPAEAIDPSIFPAHNTDVKVEATAYSSTLPPKKLEQTVECSHRIQPDRIQRNYNGRPPLAANAVKKVFNIDVHNSETISTPFPANSLITPVAGTLLQNSGKRNFDNANSENKDGKLENKSEAPSTVKPRTRRRKSLTPNLKQILQKSNIDAYDNDNNNDQSNNSVRSEMSSPSDGIALPTSSKVAKGKPSPSIEENPVGFLSPRELRYLKRRSISSKQDIQEPCSTSQDCNKTNLLLSFQKEDTNLNAKRSQGEDSSQQTEAAGVSSMLFAKVDAVADAVVNGSTVASAPSIEMSTVNSNAAEIVQCKETKSYHDDKDSKLLQQRKISGGKSSEELSNEQLDYCENECRDRLLKEARVENLNSMANERQPSPMYKDYSLPSECNKRFETNVTIQECDKKWQHQDIHHISVPQINDRVSELFEENGYSMLSQTCVSARLFACFSLVVENDKQHREMQANISGKSEQAHSPSVLQPLLPLLRSLVTLEDVCLGGTIENEESEPVDTVNYFPNEIPPLSTTDHDDSSRKKYKKRVQFSGFDCSSIIPPVDSITGSQSHQERCILALLAAAKQVKAIANLNKSDKSKASNNKNSAQKFFQNEVIASLKDIIAFCRRVRKDTFSKIHEQCAKSIGPDYPPQRILKALDQYQNDFENLLSRVDSNIASSTNPVVRNSFDHGFITPDNRFTHVEKKLAEFVGQAVRFHLREVLNAGIHTLITLEVPSDARDTAAADGCVASLFSAALRHIHGHFGLNAFECRQKQLNQANNNAPLIKAWEDSSKVLKQLLSSSSPCNAVSSLTPIEFDKILSDLEDVISVIEVSRSCRFLRELLNVPLVKELLHIGNQNREDQESGYRGWTTSIQRYASIIKNFELWKICPQDAHFVLLSGELNTFIENVNVFVMGLESSEKNYEPLVNKLSGRYQKASKKKGRKKESIKTVAQTLEDGIQRYNSFPRVVSSQ